MKVAIPRLRHDAEPNYGASDPGNHQRVGQACKPCRQRKTKCNGEKPVCGRCEELRMPCYYEDGKRERTKKRLMNLSTKTQDYENLLWELKPRMTGRDARSIETTLGKHANHGNEALLSELSSSSKDAGTEGSDADGTRLRTTSARSYDFVDRINEDFNRSDKARATGFMGNNSDIAWIQRLRKEVELGPNFQDRDPKNSSTNMPFHHATESGPGTASGTSSDPPEDLSVASMSYNLDDLAIAPTEAVEIYQLPPKEISDLFFDAYFASVHPSFPIIAKTAFLSQYSTFLDKPVAKPSNKKWLAILNMVFAIAAKYSELVHLDWRVEGEDHLVYFTRARTLSLDYDGVFSHPDLQQVQVEGLISFYLLSTVQINRSWRVCGMAVRSAISLGMNLQSISSLTSDIAKEIRYRVWWSLYTLEHLLSSMTGRPSCIPEGIYTAPLPIPFDEECFGDDEVASLLRSPRSRNSHIRMITTRLASTSTPTSNWMPSHPIFNNAATPNSEQTEPKLPAAVTPSTSLFFLYVADLVLIAREAINKLYTAEAIQRSWTEIERTIAKLNLESDTWLSKLPAVFNFTIWQEAGPFERERLSLAFLYYSTKISIGRPCLCRLNRQASHSQKSRDSSHHTATICVESACRMLDLIPDQPDPAGLYGISPWWCILHHLMQSTTVLLLESSFEMMHLPPEGAAAVLTTTKKAIRWLHYMSEENIASHRAWALCDRFIRRIAPNIGLDISDLPSVPRNLPQQQQQSPPRSSWTMDASNTTDTTNVTTTTTTITTTTNRSLRTNSDAFAAQLPEDFLSSNSAPHGDMTYASIDTDYDEYFFPNNAVAEEFNGSIFHASNDIDPLTGSFFLHMLATEQSNSLRVLSIRPQGVDETEYLLDRRMLMSLTSSCTQLQEVSFGIRGHEVDNMVRVFHLPLLRALHVQVIRTRTQHGHLARLQQIVTDSLIKRIALRLRYVAFDEGPVYNILQHKRPHQWKIACKLIGYTRNTVIFREKMFDWVTTYLV